MHASVEQLLSIRDGAPVTADIAGHVARCCECSDELARLARVRAGLQTLPAPTAPSSAWAAIAARLDAPGRRRRRWVTVAAATAVAAVVAWAALPGPRPGDPAAPAALPSEAVTTTPVSAPQPSDVDTLVAQSRQLEQLLRTLDRQSPRVMSATTAGTIAGLEDGIAVIDYGLTYDDQIGGESSQRLWRQRVDLMNSLVQVRGAQLQRVSN